MSSLRTYVQQMVQLGGFERVVAGKEYWLCDAANRHRTDPSAPLDGTRPSRRHEPLESHGADSIGLPGEPFSGRAADRRKTRIERSPQPIKRPQSSSRLKFRRAPDEKTA